MTGTPCKVLAVRALQGPQALGALQGAHDRGALQNAQAVRAARGKHGLPAGAGRPEGRPWGWGPSLRGLRPLPLDPPLVDDLQCAPTNGFLAMRPLIRRPNDGHLARRSINGCLARRPLMGAGPVAQAPAVISWHLGAELRVPCEASITVGASQGTVAIAVVVGRPRMPGGDAPEQDAWISPESQAQSVQLPHGSFLLHTGHMTCKAYLSKLACMVLVCKRPGISRV